MEQNNIGLIIKELRLKKKITQETLASGICSTSQLYRIEKGKHFPSIFLLQQISEKLGEDITKYIMFSNCKNPVYFSIFFDRLEHLRLKRKYKKILSLISEVEDTTEYNYDINLPSIKQLLGWYKGVSKSNMKNCNISVDYYINLLKLTTSFCDIDELFNGILSINEIKIIHSIVATYCRSGEYSIAKNILISLIRNIRSFNNDLEISLMPEIYYNLSKLLYIEKDYKNAIRYANSGIKVCINNDFSRVLADLFYVLGQCYERLGEMANSFKNFSKFICLYDILGHDEFSSECKYDLIKKYGTCITTLN
jgi:transcriptional regulator with XRE-family HTH domain